MSLTELQEMFKAVKESDEKGNDKLTLKLGKHLLEKIEVMDPIDIRSLRATTHYQVELRHLSIDTLTILSSIAAKGGDYENALQLLNDASDICMGLDDNTPSAKIWFRIGLLHDSRGALKDALTPFSIAHSLFESLRNHSMAAKISTSIGIVHEELGDETKALESYLDALTSYNRCQDLSGAARASASVANILAKQGNVESALEYYDTALRTHRQLGEQLHVAGVMVNIGNMYAERNEFEKALHSYQTALNIHEELNDIFGIAGVSNNIADIFANTTYQHHNDQKAEQYYLTAIEIAESNNIAPILSNVYLSLSALYNRLGRDSEARLFAKKLAGGS